MNGVDAAKGVTDQQLCSACGMCCNGVLFADVELVAGDKPSALTKLGLKLVPQGQRRAFPQPCALHEGSRCRAYLDRPQRCRLFDCRVLQNAKAGDISVRAALRAIAQARRCTARIQSLLGLLGHFHQDLPLNQCCARVLALPIDLGGGEDEVAKLRGQLMFEMQKLARLLERDFL